MLSEETKKQYLPTIGLEIHIEAKTKKKMFCNCLNDPDETKPNQNICPICLAHPGVLPTINKEAIEKVLKLGLALKCDIPSFAAFDRKNYFYPDLPKNYQITQFFKPFCLNGKLPLFLGEEGEQEVLITRIHLEEDTGKLSHFKDKTLVDYNRASRPLIELVTDPVMHDGKTAKLFAESLQVVLRNLDISDADMEKGQMRVEVNVSVSKKSLSNKLGTKVEVKNINSFKAVEKAINYEIDRQVEALESGEEIVQETRGWDDVNMVTVSQRTKEGSGDYRYFPDPDLPPINVWGEKGMFNIDDLKKSLGELPYEKKSRLVGEYGVDNKKAIYLVVNSKASDFFEKIVSELKLLYSDFKINSEEATSLIYNYLVSDLSGLMSFQNICFEELKISPENFAELILLILNNKISSKGAKIILEEMLKNNKNPEDIMKEKNLQQVSDNFLVTKIIQGVLESNPKAVGEYKSGKLNALQFLVGQVIAKSKGAANPTVVKDLLVVEIDKN